MDKYGMPTFKIARDVPKAKVQEIIDKAKDIISWTTLVGSVMLACEVGKMTQEEGQKLLNLDAVHFQELHDGMIAEAMEVRDNGRQR